jgi:putative heme-binding domain-containing protein
MFQHHRFVVAGSIIVTGLAILWTANTLLHSGDETGMKLEIRQGDHISIIGNTLADRMQHDGWLEAYLFSRFPKENLVIRNLGFSGDELTLRLRSANFGSPDHWLGKNKTDVVLAFFGYNESFAGHEGLDKFKKDLASFIKHTLAQQYNGQSAPRLVLFSPIAQEKMPDKNLPDPGANNTRLETCTKAMADIARANKVAFVDLYQISQGIYGRKIRTRPLTINGIHLTPKGNHLLARAIDRVLFAGPQPKRTAESMEKIRQAVLERNFTWFNRYRTVDGYSIYGGRADLRFVGGQTNRVVMQREMLILDIMTANRDKRIWAVAQGGDLKVDDSNIPDFIPVVTNKPGTLPGGKHLYLDGNDAIQKMTVAKNMKINLFASEKEFPDLHNAVQMSFDTKGRLWVACWPSYPHWKPGEDMNDKLLILEDTDGDGKADKATVFADKLHCPTGFAFWNGGVIVAQAPDLMFLKASDGGDKADIRKRILHGLDSADTHHTANSFVLDPGGGLYFQEGTFHHTQVETPYGPPQRCANAGVFRYEPRTQKFDIYVAYNFANPHGHVFDRWGQDIVVDGTGANPYHAALFSGHLDYPQRHRQPPQVYQQKTRPCPGMEYLSSRHFPKEMQGNLLVANVIGFQGILQYKIKDKDSSFGAEEMEPIVFSTDPNFRPSDIRIGPDGAIYFLDWQNPIIGHMQHNLRDPSRGRTHGRVYRVTYENRPLLKPQPIAGQPIEKLLDLLKEPEDRVRYRARIELGSRDSDKVLAVAKPWLAARTKEIHQRIRQLRTLKRKGLEKEIAQLHKQLEHDKMEILWLHQNHNVVNVELLREMLASADFHARAAATRVLCYWRDRVPDALELLKKQAADAEPRVRLEAVRAASFFTKAEAIEVVLISTEHPPDVYLDFVRGETMRALDPYVKKALAEGKNIPFTSLAGARFLYKNINTDQLLKMPRNKAVYYELIFRPGVRDEFRREALAGLSKLENKSELAVLLDAVRAQDEQKGQDDGSTFDLVRLLTGRPAKELVASRDQLEKLATSAKKPVTRQLGFVALVAADGNIDKAWQLGLKSVPALRDLVLAMPLIRDPGQRASLYPKVEPLLDRLPKELAKSVKVGTTRMGRYVRIELPGKFRTLTLAEVEVYSAGRNIARNGKASQSSTAYGGVASRAIDGNKSGSYGDGGQTHTAEGETNPWWEVDLGSELPINSIVIYNRTDGNLGSRLKNFTLKVIGQDGSLVFEKKNNPAPARLVSIEIGSESPERIIRHAAMQALPSVRGQETTTFKNLARFVNYDGDRHAAIQALLRIPRTYWPKDERKLLDGVLAYLRKVPAKDRTSPVALDAMQLADNLASMLPLGAAREIRKELGELGVRVIRVGTLPDQMLFDKERIVVKAGRPVEIIFENTDLMPHNLVIIRPGSLEEIGNLGETTATQPGALERHYVPKSPKILFSSRLLPPREMQKLSFTAPNQPGVYPYVCTYPGHWRRMYGALYVVTDLDEYLANPEAYLAKNPLPIADELLKFTRPRTEWKFADLASSVEKLEPGRSFSNGKQLFQVGSCVSCHKLNGVGKDFGPDLTKLDPKLKNTDILKDILEPSFRINEKYQTYKFETLAGTFHEGIILEETPHVVKIIENPLLKSEPLVLKVSNIAGRKKLTTSIMPKGLLDKMTREEILDLLAYVIARGDARHPLFQAGHEHGHKGGY